MSAFMMDERGFVQLASELDARLSNSSHTLHYAVREFVGLSWPLPVDVLPFCATKCQALYEANIAAVNDRYEDNEEAQAGEAVELAFTFQMSRWTDFQLYKALRCLRYQMSEGDVPESEIYKQLEKLCAEVAEALLSDLPQYNAVEWGWGALSGRKAA